MDGDPWIDVSLMGLLQDIEPTSAAQNNGNFNSIWQLTQHLVLWRLAIFNRMQGVSQPSPNHNYILPVVEASNKAWKKLLTELASSQKALIGFMKTLDDEQLDNIWPGKHYTVYELLHGLLQHDAYHMGQIALLKKGLGN